MGWVNWEAFGCNISEDVIKRSADALASKGLKAAGYTIVEVDDCWGDRERNATGHLAPNRNFPSGMKALGEYLHSRGFKYGLYSSAGTRTCQNVMPGSLGYEWVDAQTFAEWEVDFLKYDGCFAEGYATVEQDAGRRFPFLPPPVLKYPIMSMALNRTGRNISYMCNDPWPFWELGKDRANGGVWVTEFCNSWRVGGDAQPGFHQALSYVDMSENFASSVPSGPGAWNHLDALEIGNERSFDVTEGGGGQLVQEAGGKMTEPQERAVFSLFALVKAPLFIGADVTKLEGHSLETYLNSEVIALNQDPLGVRGHRVRAAGDPRGELWCMPLSGGDAAAVLLNRRDAGLPLNISVSWADLGFLSGDPVGVRDLWLHRHVGTFSGGFTAEVPPSSAVVLRFTAAVGTSTEEAGKRVEPMHFV